MNYRVKLIVFFLGAVTVLLVVNVGYSALQTFSQLNAVEAERDHWQRPSDILQALDLKPGNIVVDLGCGSGYFTLRLSSPVGDSGRVIAEDIRRLPLMFLRARAISRREHNVKIVVGDLTDPHLPTGVNAVLILNTYHEFTDSHPILAHVQQSLIPGGRLVVVDREPKPTASHASETAEHEISAERVEGELRQANFEIVSRQDRFIEHDSYGESWWLIIARKP